MNKEEYNKRRNERNGNQRNGNQRKEETSKEVNSPSSGVKELQIKIRNPFTKSGVRLCVAVALCATVPAFAANAVMHRTPKKETIIMFCQFNGGLLGITCT